MLQRKMKHHGNEYIITTLRSRSLGHCRNNSTNNQIPMRNHGQAEHVDEEVGSCHGSQEDTEEASFDAFLAAGGKSVLEVSVVSS